MCANDIAVDERIAILDKIRSRAGVGKYEPIGNPPGSPYIFDATGLTYPFRRKAKVMVCLRGLGIRYEEGPERLMITVKTADVPLEYGEGGV